MAMQWSDESPPLLDAALTSWNPRHKRGADGIVRIIDPDTASPGLRKDDVGPHQFLTIQEQTCCRYTVCLDGNVGASRIGTLALAKFTVLIPESNAPQPFLMRASEI